MRFLARFPSVSLLEKPDYSKLLVQFKNSRVFSLQGSTEFDSSRTTKSLFACNPDQIFITKTINSYCKCGKIEHARKLFDEMPEKNIVSFSTMIYGYASHGLFVESLQLFSRMQESGIHPNSFTFVAVLLSSVGLRCPNLGESIHGGVVKDGFGSNTYVRTCLIDMYAKCGDVNSSYNLFIEVNSPTLASCNAMITGFVLNDRFEDALLLFKQLAAFGHVPNVITLLSICQSCIGYGALEVCESVYGYIIKVGFDSDVSVLNSVLEMHLSWGNSETATCFFEKMAVKDVISWTTIMGFLLELGCAVKALDMFQRMRVTGIDLDMVTMVHVVSACADLGDLKRATSVHNQVITRGFAFELVVMNSLIRMYCRCRNLWSARILFDQVHNKSLVSWTAMVSGYVQNRQPKEGLSLFFRMQTQEKFGVDSIMLTSLLTACGELSNFEMCKQFHVYGIKLGLLHCETLQNSLVSAYGKCGYADSSFRVFQEMFHHNLISWNTMISAYGTNGKGEAALSLLQDMEKCGEVPDEVTYLNLLTACNHTGLVDDGLVLFERMVKKEKIKARGEHCGCLVDMLARAGRLDDAKKLANSALGEGSANVWKALLGRSQVHGDIQVTEIAAERVFALDANDHGQLVQLSNALASVGQFENVQALRAKLGKNNGLMKKIGFTLLDSLPCDAG